MMGAFFNALTTKGTCYALAQPSDLLLLYAGDAIKDFFHERTPWASIL